MQPPGPPKYQNNTPKYDTPPSQKDSKYLRRGPFQLSLGSVLCGSDCDDSWKHITCEGGKLRLVVPLVLQYSDEFVLCEFFSLELAFQVSSWLRSSLSYLYSFWINQIGIGSLWTLAISLRIFGLNVRHYSLSSWPAQRPLCGILLVKAKFLFIWWVRLSINCPFHRQLYVPSSPSTLRLEHHFKSDNCLGKLSTESKSAQKLLRNGGL